MTPAPGSRAHSLMLKSQPLIALLLLMAWLSVSADNFLTGDNALNVLRQISVNLCLSLGMTLVILTGGIDLSAGSVLALSGAVAAGLLRHGLTLSWLGVHLEFTVCGAFLAALLTGMAAGGVNGFCITRLKVPPFITTLGMLSIARGLTRLWTGGATISLLGAEEKFQTYAVAGTGHVAGIPVSVLTAAGLAALGWGLLRHTVLGRHIYATGGNEQAAHYSGISTDGVKMRVYLLAGLMAGAAALVHTSRLGGAEPNTGIGFELDCIAAVVIGGTSLTGGRGSIGGTIIGCLIIGVLNNGLVLLGVRAEWQECIKGALIIAAVALDRLTNRRTAG